MSWQTVLGFEIHIELVTQSKMFCGCPADHFGKAPNTQTCPVCLGLPGALPIPNARAIEWTVKLGLALGCQVNLYSKFDRKNYFYPDLPKGYQISQYDIPFCTGGELLGHKITRVHLEEDTGKLQHVDGATLIDFNRSGVPLVEVVTEPDFDNPDDGILFLKELQQIVRTLTISSADMEKGSMRLEANISVRPEGQTDLPNYKIEVKNVNSFRFIKKAIEFDVDRQIKILETGSMPTQETRGFSEAKAETVGQRSKEEAHDYRYFPEPDIPPIQFSREQVETWRSQIPTLPAEIRKQLLALNMPAALVSTITVSPARLEKYFELAKNNDPLIVAKAVANTPEDQLDELKIEPKTINSDEEAIKATAQKIIDLNPKVVADIKSGKQQALFFVIGQIKKELGDIDIPLAQKIITSEIAND